MEKTALVVLVTTTVLKWVGAIAVVAFTVVAIVKGVTITVRFGP